MKQDYIRKKKLYINNGDFEYLKQNSIDYENAKNTIESLLN